MREGAVNWGNMPATHQLRGSQLRKAMIDLLLLQMTALELIHGQAKALETGFHINFALFVAAPKQGF